MEPRTIRPRPLCKVTGVDASPGTAVFLALIIWANQARTTCLSAAIS
jgi:hypothetical protein